MSVCIDCLKPMSDADARQSMVCHACLKKGRLPMKVPKFAAIGKKSWMTGHATFAPMFPLSIEEEAETADEEDND